MSSPKAHAAAIDVHAALSGNGDASWLAPGPLQLELGGAPLQPVREGDAIEAVVVDSQGGLVRVAIRLPHVRFAAWTERTRLYAIVVRDTRVMARDSSDFAEGGIEVALHRGARVRRIAHDHEHTRVRYFGQFEVEGWVPDAAIAESGPARDTTSRVWHGGQTLTLLPGSVIRTEPKWAAHALATSAEGYFVESVKQLDDAWVEVEYEDEDIRVHGYVSKHDPPGRVHHPREADIAQVIAPNAKLADGTCVYAHEGGEPIGFVVGETDAELSPGGTGWFSVALDTPWGPITFAANGPTEAELQPCPSAP